MCTEQILHAFVLVKPLYFEHSPEIIPVQPTLNVKNKIKIKKRRRMMS